MKAIFVLSFLNLFATQSFAQGFPAELIGHYEAESNLECTVNNSPVEIPECAFRDDELFQSRDLQISSFTTNTREWFAFSESFLGGPEHQIDFVNSDVTDQFGLRMFNVVESLTDDGFRVRNGYVDSSNGASRTDIYDFQRNGALWVYTQTTDIKNRSQNDGYVRKFLVRKVK